MPEASHTTRILGIIIVGLLSIIIVDKISSNLISPSVPIAIHMSLNEHCVPCHSTYQSAPYNRKYSIPIGPEIKRDLSNIEMLRYDNLREISEKEIYRLKVLTFEELVKGTMPRQPKLLYTDFHWNKEERLILINWTKKSIRIVLMRLLMKNTHELGFLYTINYSKTL